MPRRRTSRIRRSRRALAAVLALAFALASTTGCLVMDELDSAAAKMPTSKKDKEKAEAAKSAAKPDAAAGLAATKSAVIARSREWWKEAKSMTPGEKSEGIVQCRLPEGVKFMSKDDCVVQGGRTADGSS